MKHWRALFLIVAMAMTVSTLYQARLHAQPAPKSYDPCNSLDKLSFVVAAGTSSTAFGALGSGTNAPLGPIHICDINVVPASSSTFQLLAGTGSNCATNFTTITGAYSAAPPATSGLSTVAQAPAGYDVCYRVTGTGAQGVVSYVQAGLTQPTPSVVPTLVPTATPT